MRRQYNEGWNAYHGLNAVSGGGDLYADAGSLLSNNYAPLSFFIIGWLGQAIGDNIMQGG